ncbi:hypothetical protein LOB94_03575 [Lactobacillus delbrueckii subsp. bulgaricus]|uniref:ORF 95 n=1 Tax=Lactococcus phage mv4 TaxID=12392 RepID=Q9G0C7_BPMV4|nr:hypothetical protein [Lactobacillus delbrueckii]AAG31341.1 ORF 95 [Lactobacillus phage mv4]MCD5464885.1 hypothetical protein [Lactobacillus delbrueckii subsp. bulgaricus]MCD5482378.1 hypothetical protein [Lactobacillus delbrueckii subsp. bulgaricus]MCD5482430.1 hypothetical protein [Lactobacillus delbrueckii subsp. bulgaricus]MCT3468548.1 hypothetical protein [Lactobacillus delbrueckii subsp. bulgaricus]
MTTLGEMIRKHREDLLQASDTFEDVLYAEAKESSKTPYGAIMTLKKAKGDLPDSYAGTKEDIISYALASKEIDNVINRIRSEALKRVWEDEDAAQ